MIDIRTEKGAREAMELAWSMGEASQCLKKKVGSVLINYHTGEVEGVGYGSPKIPCKTCVRKSLSWTQDGCWSMHAEPRAIFNRFHSRGYCEDLHELVMFVTHGPCDQCIKYMNFFNISHVVYEEEYKTDYSKWEGHGIRIHSLDNWIAYNQVVWGRK